MQILVAMATKVKNLINLPPTHYLDSNYYFAGMFPRYRFTDFLQKKERKKKTVKKHGFYLRVIFLLLWYRVKLCRIYNVQGRLLWVKQFKSWYELLPFGALVYFLVKMHNTSKFWSIKFIDANFFYYSIYDRFIQRQPCVCMHL